MQQLLSQLLFPFRLVRWLALLLGLLGTNLSVGQAQQLLFDAAYQAGDAHTSGESWLRALAQDAQGNVYVGGQFAGGITFGTQQFMSHVSQFDLYVAKYSPDGDLVWARTAGLDGSESVQSLAVDAAGNVYVGGSYSGPTQFGTLALAATASGQHADGFVAKLDASGTWQWAVSAGGAGVDFVTSLALNPAGQLVVGGAFGSAQAAVGPFKLTNLNPWPSGDGFDVFVAQLSPAGTWLGAVAAGGAGSDYLQTLAVDATGATYVCGNFTSPHAQFGAATLTNAASDYTQDGFVAKLDAASTWQWATSLGGSAQDYLMGLALDAAGRPYVAGSFRSPTLVLGAATLTNAAPGTHDLVVAALGTNGSWRWATRSGDTADDIAEGLALGPTGELTLAGQFYGRQLVVGSSTLTSTTAAGSAESFVARLGAGGNWLTGLVPTGPGEKDARCVVAGATGDAYVAGIYWGNQATFGEAELPGNNFFPNCFIAHVAEAAALPRVASVVPSSAVAGQTITLQGTGFVDVRSVRFKEVPATYQVQSATRLLATVPVGTATGRIRVRTAAGTGVSSDFFAPVALSTASASAASSAQLWPNPVASAAALHLQLPADLHPVGLTQVEVHNALGELVAHTEFSGSASTWALVLPAGLYHLTLRPAGQAAIQQPLTVVN